MINFYNRSNVNRFFLFLLLLLLGGCQSVSSYYRGDKIEKDRYLVLDEKVSQKGQWKAFDLTIAYQLQPFNDRLKVSGSVQLSDYLMMSIRRIENLDVYLFFLDREKWVVETVQIAKVFSEYPEQVISFKQELPLPEQAWAVSFGYRGQVQEDDEDGFIFGGAGRILDDLPTMSR